MFQNLENVYVKYCYFNFYFFQIFAFRSNINTLPTRLPRLETGHLSAATTSRTKNVFPNTSSKPSPLQRCRSLHPIRTCTTSTTCHTPQSRPVETLSSFQLDEETPCSVSSILCQDYSTRVKSFLEDVEFKPYFANWTISGFKNDTVCKNCFCHLSISMH